MCVSMYLCMCLIKFFRPYCSCNHFSILSLISVEGVSVYVHVTYYVNPSIVYVETSLCVFVLNFKSIEAHLCVISLCTPLFCPCFEVIL